jgi:hypothetical protein
MRLLAVASIVAMSVTGCFSSVHEYQAAGYAPSADEPRSNLDAKPIRADAQQFVVLGITDNTDYVNEAYARLLAQCAGEIVGVNTRYSTELGFLSYTNNVQMEALCLNK